MRFSEPSGPYRKHLLNSESKLPECFPRFSLYLAPVASDELLKEQERVQTAVEPLASRPWPHFEKGAWIPHITTGWFLKEHEMAAALPLVLDALPLLGCLDRGGVEDGTTGENWPVLKAAQR
jgi:hypothetical protein